MRTIEVFRAMFILEFIARIVGPPGRGPYLMSLTAAEPMTDFESHLYREGFPSDRDC